MDVSALQARTIPAVTVCYVAKCVLQNDCHLLHRRIAGSVRALGRCWQPVTTRVAWLGLVPRSTDIISRLHRAALFRKKCRLRAARWKVGRGTGCVNKHGLAARVHTGDCGCGGRQVT